MIVMIVMRRFAKSCVFHLCVLILLTLLLFDASDGCVCEEFVAEEIKLPIQPSNPQIIFVAVRSEKENILWLNYNKPPIWTWFIAPIYGDLGDGL